VLVWVSLSGRKKECILSSLMIFFGKSVDSRADFLSLTKICMQWMISRVHFLKQVVLFNHSKVVTHNSRFTKLIGYKMGKVGIN